MRSIAVPANLTAAWQHTLANWNQRTSHDMLLGLTVKHQQFAWLAMRYREAARSNPRDFIARDRLKGVQRAAAMLVFTAPVAREAPGKKRSGPMLLVAVVVCTALALWLTDMMRQQQHTLGPDAAARSQSSART